MPKVDAFEVAGLDIRFHSNDHLPPHIHVTKPGEWSIKVFILETTAADLSHQVTFGTRIPAATRRETAALVAANREALLHEWEHKVQKDC